MTRYNMFNIQQKSLNPDPSIQTTPKTIQIKNLITARKKLYRNSD